MTPEQRAIADVLTFARWWGQDWAMRRLEQATIERAELEVMPSSIVRASERLSVADVVARVRRDLNADVRIEEVHPPVRSGGRWYLIVSHAEDPDPLEVRDG